jgi:hypothetical protein
MKALSLSAAAGLIRSAEIQSAVSQVCNLPGARHCGGFRTAVHAADCKSAIQQTTSLRYMATRRRCKASGPALKVRGSSAQGKALGNQCSVVNLALKGRTRVAPLQGLVRCGFLFPGLRPGLTNVAPSGLKL